MPEPADSPQPSVPGARPGWPLRIFRAAGRLPLPVLRALGAATGVLAWALSGSYRRKVNANLAIAGYGTLGARLRAAAEAGRMSAELPWIWTRSLAEVAARVRCDDHAVLDDAEAAGRGILFLTPHLGSFEVTARYYAQRAPITVMFKPPRKRWLDEVVSLSRGTERMRAVPAALAGVRAMLRALRAGEAVGLLPDQVPSDGEGVWAPFFGRPAYTMTLPQRLAEATGARVVLAIGERLRGAAGWRVHFEAMDEPPTPEAVNARMEALIRRHPDQYLWGYNRYKAPGPGGGK